MLNMHLEYNKYLHGKTCYKIYTAVLQRIVTNLTGGKKYKKAEIGKILKTFPQYKNMKSTTLSGIQTAYIACMIENEYIQEVKGRTFCIIHNFLRGIDYPPVVEPVQIGDKLKRKPMLKLVIELFVSPNRMIPTSVMAGLIAEVEQVSTNIVNDRIDEYIESINGISNKIIITRDGYVCSVLIR